MRGVPMTKSDLINRVAAEKKLAKGRAETLVNRIFDCVAEALGRGERVEIRGVGSFEIRRYGAYRGRNPRTGATVAVNPKRLPFFKTGKELRDRINGESKRTQEMPAVDSSPLHLVRAAEPRSA
jgi:integration host factor subunit beta